jgi:hypothetical protein
MERNCWGIVCPGPSLNSYKMVKRICATSPDHLVAVNGAVLFPGRAEYWAVCDIEVFAHCIRDRKYWDPGVTLWAPQRWQEDMWRAGDLRAKFTVLKKELFPANSNEEFGQIMPFGKDIHWRERTMFIAIGMAIRHGAREIRIFGADLEGGCYFQEGLENCRTRLTEKRWIEERFWLNRIIDACADEGIAVIREVIDGQAKKQAQVEGSGVASGVASRGG